MWSWWGLVLRGTDGLPPADQPVAAVPILPGRPLAHDRPRAGVSTSDDRHLLNVPASGMSAFPRDPEHFFRWVRNHHDRDAQPQDFIPRRVYGDYIHSLLQTASEYPGNARLERREEAVVGIARRKDRFTVRLSSGQTIVARAVVLATGSSPGIDWAPAELSAADVADPWTDELPDGDLLLVGTGLTMVDVAIAADRPGRRLHTVSRHDLIPAAHRLPTTPMVPPPPGITRIGTLQELQRVVDAHVERTVEETGDWRAAVDGLRPVTAQLWQGLCEDDKRRFRDDLARTWEIHRHRMSPETARRLDAIADSGRLVRHIGTVESARRRGTGFEVTLTDGSQVDVAGVVNCTGPVGGTRQGPVARHAGAHRPGPPRSLGTGHRHRGRRPGARRTPGQDAALRPRRVATRQPVGDHRDARDPRAGLRRRPVRRTRAARRDPAPPVRRLRPHPDHETVERRTPTTRRSDACSGCRTASRRVSSRPPPSTPASPRRTPHWHCWGTSGAPPDPGAGRWRRRTPLPPRATSTTER